MDDFLAVILFMIAGASLVVLALVIARALQR